MAITASVTGLLPNILSRSLSSVFTPSTMSVATYGQAALASLIAWIVGLQFMPSWEVWVALIAIMYGQVILKESILQQNYILIGDGLSGDSVEHRKDFGTDQTIVLA